MIRPGTARMCVLLVYAALCCWLYRFVGEWTIYVAVVCSILLGIVVGSEVRRNKKNYRTMTAPVRTAEQFMGLACLIIAVLLESFTFTNLYIDTSREAKLQDYKEIMELKEVPKTPLNISVLMPNYYTTAIGVYSESLLLMDEVKDCMNQMASIEEGNVDEDALVERMEKLNNRFEELKVILDACRMALTVHVICIVCLSVLYLLAKRLYYGYIFVKPPKEETFEGSGYGRMKCK